MPRRRLIAAALGLTLIAAACGTRLDDADFVAAARGQGVESVGGDDELLATEDLTGTDSDGTTGGDGGTTSGGTRRTGGNSTSGGGTRTGGGTGGTGSGGGGGGSAAPTSCGGTNTASDTGITPTTITVGNLRAVTGILGPEAFAGPYQGAQAFFQDLNARGGVCGRKIKFVSCDDKENADKNRECVRKLINDTKIFAFVGNATRSHAGAPIEAEQKVPDVAGVPINNAYYKWPTFFSIYGADGLPRDGTQVGVGGKLYAQSGDYRWFKEKLGITKAAVIFYDEPASRQAGEFIEAGLTREDIEVVYKPADGQGRNLADPAWDSEAIRMRAAGAQALWQAIDLAGFQKLCEAMDRNSFQVQAAVTTIAGWSQSVGSTFSKQCRQSIFATGSTVPYSRTEHPEIKKFRDAMAKYFPDFVLRQWAVDGWSAAALFVEAVKSMGATPTRAGIVKYLNGLDGSYQGPNDIMEPDNWDWRLEGANFAATEPDCFTVAKWDEGAGAFVDQSGTPDSFVCLPSTYYTYEPVPDGST